MSISALSDLSDAVVAPVALNESLLDLLLIDGAMATLKRAADGRPVWASPSWQDWVGGEAPLPQPVASAIQAADARALASGQPMSVDDHVFERADGRRVELRALRRVLHGLAGEPLLLTLWRDVTAVRRESMQLQQALGQIERLQQAIEAMRRQHEQGLDRPGELFRREHFEEHLRREAALSQREHREFALVLLAIDRIEAMRQSHGEAAVQRIVEMMGHLMRTNTRAMDVLSQLGTAASRSCCPASAWRPPMRAWSICAAPAPPRWWCRTVAAWASRSRSASPASRTRPRRWPSSARPRCGR